MINILAVATVNKTKPSHAVTTRSSRRHRAARRSVDWPIHDARFHRLVGHLHRLGPRPVAECFLQLVGTQDDARTALIVLLERYGELDAGVVQALGADHFPPTIFPVGPT